MHTNWKIVLCLAFTNSEHFGLWPFSMTIMLPLFIPHFQQIWTLQSSALESQTKTNGQTNIHTADQCGLVSDNNYCRWKRMNHIFNFLRPSTPEWWLRLSETDGPDGLVRFFVMKTYATPDDLLWSPSQHQWQTDRETECDVNCSVQWEDSSNFKLSKVRRLIN